MESAGAGESAPIQAPPQAPARASASEDTSATVAVKKERPGLATQFGEDIQSRVRHASFERATPTSPFATTTIWYNDQAGVEAMAQASREHAYGRAEVELFQGGLAVRLLDEHQQVLRGMTADRRPCAIGEAGARYSIGVENKSDFTFEIVVSVDGLSVIDGKPAAFDRSGYILYAHQSIGIDGFRTSDQSVAAFRFGKVSQSYSVEMGHGDRNVGVIGVAFFHEQGKTPVYPSEDTRRREQADPFPGQYAPRPNGR
jgi:hypothetical protein